MEFKWYILFHCSQFLSGKKNQTISRQWIHHNLRIQSSWPFLSLPIWWPAEDWWTEQPRVRADTFYALPPWRWERVHDHQAGICLFLSLTLPLLNDGTENEKWGLILKYQFPGWSRIIYRLSVSFVILQRFWFTIGKYVSQACFLWDSSFEFIFGLRIAAPAFNKHCSTLVVWLFSELLTWPCS